jgi:DNA-binding IclR family transcriptional regulator
MWNYWMSQLGQPPKARDEIMERDGTQSIRRALDVLDVLASIGSGGARLSDITRLARLNAPTAHRILSVLVEREIVERNPATRRYQMGQQIPNLALARTARSPLVMAVEPHMHNLAKKIGDTIYLTVRAGFDALCIARCFGDFHIQVVTIQVGARRPLGVSAAGVAMLASMETEEMRNVVSKNSHKYALAGLSIRQLETRVAQTKTKGYFLRERGLVSGTRAVSIAIPATENTPIAALTIGAVDDRLTARRASEVAELMQATARKLFR